MTIQLEPQLQLRARLLGRAKEAL